MAYSPISMPAARVAETADAAGTAGADATTTAQLLTTLRDATGRADLRFAGAPRPLTGGYYAEMLRFRLVDPPAGLGGALVARIVPDRSAGEWESTIQRAVADQGFPTPKVRLVVGESSPLRRFLIVMDAVDGEPPMSGLSAGAVVVRLPQLMRTLPDQLAGVAADLHRLDPGPLTVALDALERPFPATVAGFVEQLATQARAAGRPDLADAATRLLATEPRSTRRVITHGDLHPFNLLVTADGTSVVDWTVARVAHPGFTVGFTELMLANPPIAVPRAGEAAIRLVGRRMARRFVSTYRSLTDGTPAAVDDADLAWHRHVHALRILVELATWEREGRRPVSGHPWLILEPVAARSLGLG